MIGGVLQDGFGVIAPFHRRFDGCVRAAAEHVIEFLPRGALKHAAAFADGGEFRREFGRRF